DDGADDGADDGGDDGSSSDEPLTVEEVQYYLAKIAPRIAGRSLTYEENARIAEEGEAAIYPIIEAWTTEPGFGEAMRYMIETQLHTSGSADGVDFNLPGNLANEIATLGLPW